MSENLFYKYLFMECERLRVAYTNLNELCSSQVKLPLHAGSWPALSCWEPPTTWSSVELELYSLGRELGAFVTNSRTLLEEEQGETVRLFSQFGNLREQQLKMGELLVLLHDASLTFQAKALQGQPSSIEV